MAEMLTDLIQNIYTRIAGLGKSINDLKESLEKLNSNIDEKITNLTGKMSEFSSEIELTRTKHTETLKEIGEGATLELKKLQEGIGLTSFEGLIKNLEDFSRISSEVLNQDTVNLLLSEAIENVKHMKKNLREN